MIVVIVSLGGVTFPFFANGASVRFFEFAPDKADRLRVIAEETPYQLFQPQSQYIAGLDVWADNSGPSGEISFGLRDDTDTLLTATTITVPTALPQWGGKRIHVDFPLNIRVSWNRVYSVKILSDMSDLRLYYAPKIQLLQNNSSYSADYRWGAARLGAVEQDFTFKFALYENAETLPPMLSNATTTLITSAKATLQFTADEPVDYSIAYTPGAGESVTIGRRNEFIACAFINAPCSADMVVLPNRSYTYTLTVYDAWGNSAKLSGAFTTPGEGVAITGTLQGESQSIGAQIVEAIRPPSIYNERIVGASETAVEAAWATDEAATTELLIEQGGVPIVRLADPFREFAHAIGTGAILKPKTTYFATLISKNAAGAEGTKTLTFTTAAKKTASVSAAPAPAAAAAPSPPAVPQTLPVISAAGTPPASVSLIILPPAPGAADGSITIRIDEIAGAGEGVVSQGYRVDILDENEELKGQVFVPAGAKEFSLPKDLPNGTYSLVVYRNRNGVFERVAILTTINVARAARYQRFIYVWWGILGALALTAAGIFMYERMKRV